MIKKTSLLFSVTIAIATLLLTSCTTKIDIDDLGDVTLNQSIVLPIGSVSASIEDMIAMIGLDEYLSIDSNLVDNKTTYYIGWELDNMQVSIMESVGDFSMGSVSETNMDIAALPEVAEIFELYESLPNSSSITSITLPEMSYVINDTSTYEFEFNTDTEEKVIRVDQINISESTLNIEFNVEDMTFSENSYILFEISFPMLEEQYSHFEVIIDSENVSYTKVLNDFSVIFDNDLNSTDMYFTYTIVSDGAFELGRGAKIDISTQFNLIDFDLMQGYYWQEDVLYNNVYYFDLPSTLTSQNFIFSEPELSVHLESNLGAGTELTFNYLYTTDKNGNTEYAEFDNGETSTTIIINSPEIPGEYASTDVIFNNEFGSLGSILQSNSTKISADLSLNLSEDENESSYIINPDEIKMVADLYLPLQFEAGSGIMAGDTFALNFGTIESYTEFIEEFYVFIDAENSIPVDLNISLIFTDENYNELFSHNDITISSPEVDSEGKSLSTEISEINVEFEKTEVAEINKIKYLIFDASLAGNDNDSKIYFQTTDFVKFTLAAFAKFNGEIDLNEIL